jgi:hypothetical protein
MYPGKFRPITEACMLGLTGQITQAWNCPWKKYLSYKASGDSSPKALPGALLTLENSASLIGQICLIAFVANEGITDLSLETEIKTSHGSRSSLTLDHAYRIADELVGYC